MQRIYFPNAEFSQLLEITQKELYHQLTRVLRCRVWQELIFFDGTTQEDYLYRINHIDKTSVNLTREKIISKQSELISELALYQAFPNKLSKFETIVQKCCEVWYSKIIFFESERSQKIILSDNKKQRLLKIAIEAIELCWGNKLPEIEFRQKIWDLMQYQSIICHTQWDDATSLSDIKVSKKLNIIVGPEGGFSPDEMENIPAQKVYFGKRILRCETVWEVVWFYISQKKES